MVAVFAWIGWLLSVASLQLSRIVFKPRQEGLAIAHCIVAEQKNKEQERGREREKDASLMLA